MERGEGIDDGQGRRGEERDGKKRERRKQQNVLGGVVDAVDTVVANVELDGPGIGGDVNSDRLGASREDVTLHRLTSIEGVRERDLPDLIRLGVGLIVEETSLREVESDLVTLDLLGDGDHGETGLLHPPIHEVGHIAVGGLQGGYIREIERNGKRVSMSERRKKGKRREARERESKRERRTSERLFQRSSVTVFEY